MIIGYTQGVYDLFHVGHLRLLQNAAARCDRLIVGINSDRLTEEYKNHKPVIPEEDRREIAAGIRGVDEAVIADTLDKREMWEKLHFDVIFIGSDWKGNERWKKTEEEMTKLGVKVIYLPHTDGISSESLRAELSGR